MEIFQRKKNEKTHFTTRQSGSFGLANIHSLAVAYELMDDASDSRTASAKHLINFFFFFCIVLHNVSKKCIFTFLNTPLQQGDEHFEQQQTEMSIITIALKPITPGLPGKKNIRQALMAFIEQLPK